MKMIVLGRLGRDAELRYTANQEPVMNLALAYNYGKKEDNTTQWLDATVWGKRAEAIAQWMVKGQQLMVTVNDVHIETYDGKDGPGHKLVGRVEDIEFGAAPPDGGGQRSGGGQGQQRSNGGGQQRQAPQQRQQPERSPGQRSNQQRQAAPARQPAASGGASGFDDMDDDIPF